MLISIILPAYNVRPYLQVCVDSILESKLSPEIYEIIIIDDGSTDGTGQLGEMISTSFAHIKYYKQSNQGVSAARNLGLTLASNKYIWFIDPDDVVKSELVLDMVYQIIDTDLDALGMNYFGIAEDGSPLSKAKGKLFGGIGRTLSGGEFYQLNYKRSYIWQYIFRREIFLSHNIRFIEGMVMEDSEILPKLMANIYRMGIYEKSVYGYRRRKNSLLRTTGPESELFFLSSAIKLAESLNLQQKQFSHYKGIAKGLDLKIRQVNQILYLKFINGRWNKAQRQQIILDMKNKGVFPFLKITNLSPLMNFRLNTWRLMVNLLPIQISQIYQRIN